jgi:tripartite-type tricarboxylate transporter receptor subunit TctC
MRKILCTLALAAFPLAAGAQYPNKPIRVVVPFPAGTATDTITRALAQSMSQAIGQPVVVENKAGADGVIGATEVMNAPADGYTVLMATNSPLAAVPTLRKQPPYDPLKAFTPVTRVGLYTFFLFVHTSVPAKSLDELVAYGRANPDKLNYATGNTTGIVSIAQVMALGGFRMVHVPYKGEPPAMTDLVTGRVQVMMATPTTGLPHAKDGKLRALATTLSQRSHLLPDVPTMAEAGMPKFAIFPWAALVGPAGMPRDLVERLNREMHAAMKRPDVLTVMDKQAFQLTPSTPEETAAFIKDQLDLWGRTIKEAGIQPE